jgi:hypothetical protein
MGRHGHGNFAGGSQQMMGLKIGWELGGCKYKELSSNLSYSTLFVVLRLMTSCA